MRQEHLLFAQNDGQCYLEYFRLRTLPALVSPIEAAAENAFHDPVVGGGCRAHAYAKVDLPLRRDIQIDGREELLLLIMQAGNVGDAAVVGVVLKAARDLLGEVVA